MGARTHDHHASSRLIGLTNSCPAADKSTGGKIRSGDDLHQLMNGQVGVIKQGYQSVHNLGQVMGRNLGRHAYGNTLGTVDQDIGNLGRQNRWFLQRVIVVGDKIDGFLVQIGNDFLVKFGHPGLGIPHSRRGITIHGTKVTLAVNQRIAQRKILGHTDQGIVGRRIAMGMILTNDITDDPR